MIITSTYKSPLGKILLAADDIGLRGLWFEGQAHFAEGLFYGRSNINKPLGQNQIIKESKKWLDIYFSGMDPGFLPPLHPQGSEFRLAVWKLLMDIPYGKTSTYGQLADRLSKIRAWTKPAARPVGGAVSHNNISLIIPCHRVLGSKGKLTGYAGGIDRKIFLLKLEGIRID